MMTSYTTVKENGNFLKRAKVEDFEVLTWKQTIWLPSVGILKPNQTLQTSQYALDKYNMTNAIAQGHFPVFPQKNVGCL